MIQLRTTFKFPTSDAAGSMTERFLALRTDMNEADESGKCLLDLQAFNSAVDTGTISRFEHDLRMFIR